jgi:hypothetical protein
LLLFWAEIDRYTGLVATSATQGTDLVRMAFKPGTAPRTPSTSETITAVREARDRAHTQAVEHRVWGAGVPPPPPPPAPPGQGGTEDPNL